MDTNFSADWVPWRLHVNRNNRPRASPPSLLIAALALVLLSGALASAQEHKSGHWGYDGDEGPSHWGDMSPEFASCKTGHHQSPIDIRNPQKADLPPIQFDYQSSPLHIIDNGHTIMINYAAGSSIRVGDKQYTLKQFHFHRPSEEKINGKTFDMVVHLVHADRDGNSGGRGRPSRKRKQQPPDP